jgi:hypothetical protein
MRATTLLALTVATLLVPAIDACAPKRSALDIASSQLPSTPPASTTPDAPATPAPAPVATTTPTTTPATTPATPAPSPAAPPAKPGTPTPTAPASTPAAKPAVAQPSPACLAGCNSPSLAPEVQQTCRVQCARLAQEAAGTPAPAQPQPDYAAQRARCEAGCDSERDPGDRATCRLNCGQIGPASGGYSTGGGSPVSYPSGTPSSPQQQQQIAQCQAQCDSETSVTDRATCRNNCGAVGTVVGPAGPSQWVLGPTPPMSEAEQRAAVIRSSGGVVQGSGGATTAPKPPTPQPQGNPQCAAQAQTCRNACAGSQTTCAADCNKGKMSETDRATCHLTCTSAGDTCRDDCRIKEGACQPPTYR